MKVDFNSYVGRSLGRQTYTDQRVGIELEYEGVTGVFDTPVGWKTTHDYSLRAGGMEFVSRPLKDTELDTKVRRVVNAAKQGGAKATIRCGLHVHVNVTHLTWHQMYKFITLYTLLEPTLFKEFAAGRENSHFCVPTWCNTSLTECLYVDGQRLRSGITIPGVTRANWAAAAAYLRGKDMPGSRPKLTMLQTPKYAALNMNSLKQFGTLEFRQAPSTLAYTTIVRWAKLLLRIQTEALNFESPEEIVHTYDQDGLFTLCERVGLVSSAPVDEMDQEDAADAACIIAGHVPVDWQQLEWEVASCVE